MDYETAFTRAGTLGRAQLLIIVMVYVVFIYAGWQTIVPVFTAIDVLFYCADNETITTNATFDKKCVHGCELYVYKEDISSIVSEFDLACGSNKIMASLSNSAFWFPGMFSSVFFGAASDRFGRKPVYLACTIVYAACNLVTSFSQSIWLYTSFRFLAGIFYGGVAATAFLLMTETVERAYLAQLSTGAMVIYAVGEIIGAVIGYLSKSSWRLQVVVVSAAPIPIFLVFAFFINESPLWLHSKKRYREAEKVLQRIAKLNGVDPSEVTLSPGETLPEDVKVSGTKVSQDPASAIFETKENSDQEVLLGPNTESPEFIESASLLDLFRTFPAFMLSIGQICSWFTVSLVYYGLTFGVDGISGNAYLNSILLALCEFPVWFVSFAMDKYGRKTSFYVCLILASVACLILPFTEPVAGGSFQIGFAMVGKGMVTAAFDLLYTYTPELYPTVLRGSGLLMCSAAGSSATILAPFIADIEFGIYNCTPYIIFAVFGIASSGFTIAYGIETLGQPLLNTKEEFFVAAKAGRIQKRASHATDE